MWVMTVVLLVRRDTFFVLDLGLDANFPGSGGGVGGGDELYVAVLNVNLCIDILARGVDSFWIS